MKKSILICIFVLAMTVPLYAAESEKCNIVDDEIGKHQPLATERVKVTDDLYIAGEEYHDMWLENENGDDLGVFAFNISVLDKEEGVLNITHTAKYSEYSSLMTKDLKAFGWTGNDIAYALDFEGVKVYVTLAEGNYWLTSDTLLSSPEAVYFDINGDEIDLASYLAERGIDLATCTATKLNENPPTAFFDENVFYKTGSVLEYKVDKQSAAPYTVFTDQNGNAISEKYYAIIPYDKGKHLYLAKKITDQRWEDNKIVTDTEFKLIEIKDGKVLEKTAPSDVSEKNFRIGTGTTENVGVWEPQEREKLPNSDLYKFQMGDSVIIEDVDGNTINSATSISVFDEEEGVFILYHFIPHGGDSYESLMTSDGNVFASGSSTGGVIGFDLLHFGDVKVYAARRGQSPYDVNSTDYYDTKGNKIDIAAYLAEHGEKFENGTVEDEEKAEDEITPFYNETGVYLHKTSEIIWEKEGSYSVYDRSLFFLTDKDNNPISKEYASIEPYDEKKHLYKVVSEKNGKWKAGKVDQQGRISVPDTYESKRTTKLIRVKNGKVTELPYFAIYEDEDLRKIFWQSAVVLCLLVVLAFIMIKKRLKLRNKKN